MDFHEQPWTHERRWTGIRSLSRNPSSRAWSGLENGDLRVTLGVTAKSPTTTRVARVVAGISIPEGSAPGRHRVGCENLNE